jgi:small conductance mechanosensitive channel
MLSYRVRAVVLTGVICVAAVWYSPGRSRAVNAQEVVPEETQADANPSSTTNNIEIPIDELQLLVKPLTQEQLQTEAQAWLLLLQNKAREISDAEIAIKRQNRQIQGQQDAVKALGDAQKALAEAEAAQATARPGSEEYKTATEKVEASRKELQKAKEALQEVAKARQELQEDEALQTAVQEAEESNKAAQEIETANQAIAALKKWREDRSPGSWEYDEVTAIIADLEAAIQEFEDAQTALEEVEPDSVEAETANQDLALAKEALQKARNAAGNFVELEGTEDTTATQAEADQSLDEATETLEAVEGDATAGNGESEAVGEADVAQQQRQLEEAVQQLQESADAESELKNQLVVNVTELQAERTGIVDRFKVILDELQNKGGEVESYNQYIQAVSGIEIDLQDTEGLGVRLVSWLKSEEGGMRWGINLAKFTGIIIASAIAAQILGFILNQALLRFGNTSEVLRRFGVTLVKRGGVVVGVLLALTALEVSLGPILALVGGASFVLAFALQSNLGNLASGLMIMAYKPFDIGDEVKVDGIWGWIDSITLANTKITGFAGQMYTVPNNTVWNQKIENLTYGDKRKMSLFIDYDFSVDLVVVEKLLMEIMTSHPDVLDDPAPATFNWMIQDYSIQVGVSGWAETPKFWGMWHDVLQQIQERFTKEGIAIKIPKQDLRVQYTSAENTTPSSMNVLETEPKRGQLPATPSQSPTTYS